MFNLFRPKIVPPEPDLPVAFGYKCAWLAIRSASVLEVALGLKLARTEPANWATGLERAYAGEVFVSPVVGAWVLAISTRLPEASPKRGSDRLIPLLVTLSQRFGEAQYFGSNRVVEYQAWAKARQGQIVRAYAYLGESGVTLWNIGPETPEELELGLNVFDEASPEAASEGDRPRTDLIQPDEDTVLAMARKWSVDPSFPVGPAGPVGPYVPGVGVAGRFRDERP